MTVELLTKLSHMCNTICNKEPDFQANSCHTVTSLHDATSLQQHANRSCLQLCTCCTACRSSCMTHQTNSKTLLSDNRCQGSLPGAEAGSYALQRTKTSALLLCRDHHLIPHPWNSQDQRHKHPAYTCYSACAFHAHAQYRWNRKNSAVPW